MTRGEQARTESFMKFMQTQMFPWKRKNLKTGKDDIVGVQGALRPVLLWEYVFPEESLNEVLTMLDIPDNGYKGQRDFKSLKYKILRKALGKGVKPIPKYKKVPTNKFIDKQSVSIYPIGIKKDKRQKMPHWGYEQELL